jgi:hypothetical protein
MKIKLGSWADYDFDKEDAKIAVPLILLLLGLAFTPLRKGWLLAGVAAYYALYFFYLGASQRSRNCLLGYAIGELSDARTARVKN